MSRRKPVLQVWASVFKHGRGIRRLRILGDYQTPVWQSVVGGFDLFNEELWFEKACCWNPWGKLYSLSYQVKLLRKYHERELDDTCDLVLLGEL